MSSNKRKAAKLSSIGKNFDSLKKYDGLIAFNFSLFTYGDNYGEGFDIWARENYLLDLNEKLVMFSGKTRLELKQDKTLEEYRAFPKDSRFKVPNALAGKDVKWARLRLTGERRLIGVFFSGADTLFEKDVFYVVFLDKNHQFAPYHKK